MFFPINLKNTLPFSTSNRSEPSIYTVLINVRLHSALTLVWIIQGGEKRRYPFSSAICINLIHQTKSIIVHNLIVTVNEHNYRKLSRPTFPGSAVGAVWPNHGQKWFVQSTDTYNSFIPKWPHQAFHYIQSNYEYKARTFKYFKTCMFFVVPKHGHTGIFLGIWLAVCYESNFKGQSKGWSFL